MTPSPSSTKEVAASRSAASTISGNGVALVGRHRDGERDEVEAATNRFVN
jgi:hypothetical protein